MRLIREIRPKFVFLENVSAIRTRGLDTVLKELTNARYDCRWTMLSASDFGALHKRERWFLLANSYSKSSFKTNSFTEPKQIKEKSWIRSSRQDRRIASKTYWDENKPPILGVDDGIRFRVDRAKALGNSVVPQQCNKAFKILMGL